MGNKESKGVVPETPSQVQPIGDDTKLAENAAHKTGASPLHRNSNKANDSKQDDLQWPASVGAGITRTLVFGIKQIGVTGKVMHRIMTKQAFLHLGRRSMIHAASSPAIQDEKYHAQQRKHEMFQNGKVSWSGRFTGKS